jgi:hypothetical protein
MQRAPTPQSEWRMVAAGKARLTLNRRTIATPERGAIAKKPRRSTIERETKVAIALQRVGESCGRQGGIYRLIVSLRHLRDASGPNHGLRLTTKLLVLQMKQQKHQASDANTQRSGGGQRPARRELSLNQQPPATSDEARRGDKAMERD